MRRAIVIAAFGLFLALFFLPSGAHAQSVINSQLTVTVTAVVPGDEGTSTPPDNGGGGGSGGGSGPSGILYVPNATDIIMKGFAYPGGEVTLLKDGQVYSERPVSNDGSFEIDISGLAPGTYVFGFKALDPAGNSSSLQTFSVPVTSGNAVLVSGIVAPPTLAAQAKTGSSPLSVGGYAMPNALVNLYLDSGALLASVRAAPSGAWSIPVAILSLPPGTSTIQAQSSLSIGLTAFSIPIQLYTAPSAPGLPSTPTVPVAPSQWLPPDFNHDGHVDSVDFAILKYWYLRKPPASTLKGLDLNGDGRIDLPDFSILAYYWTG